MYSTHHGAISLAVGALAWYALEPMTVFDVAVSLPVAVAYAVFLGVFVDLDHFLIARLRTGSWAALRFCLSHPSAALLEQERIFAEGDVGVVHRLASHHAIGGVLVAVVAFASLPLAALTAIVLYAHVFSDLCWDVWLLKRQGETITANGVRSTADGSSESVTEDSS